MICEQTTYVAENDECILTGLEEEICTIYAKSTPASCCDCCCGLHWHSPLAQSPHSQSTATKCGDALPGIQKLQLLGEEKKSGNLV